ncbi:SatD family protein [Pedobacter sp. MC2016-24]|uniref:SatD family protein n=1 Tax=Pedobacter sp. MC2016-24 TaxID=2780090 RepID=UPI001882F926|nr:SatD family protein [Pedobacter sp. MC2016-24]MBE9601479.1 hypothetical protein [Pedobacter sp. MC2016-24]
MQQMIKLPFKHKMMEKKPNFILMADVIDSRKKNQEMLMKEFKEIVNKVNKIAKNEIISPMTITLGDEFQGVVDDLKSAIVVVTLIEEEIIQQQANFKLRYVIVEGEIDTPINKKSAHEMLGSGLTSARNLLGTSKQSNSRFFIELNENNKSKVLADIFSIYQRIIDDWKIAKDYQIISAFIQLKDYKLVAEKLDKDKSLMWRREKTMRIKDYMSVKNIMKYIGENKNV